MIAFILSYMPQRKNVALYRAVAATTCKQDSVRYFKVVIKRQRKCRLVCELIFLQVYLYIGKSQYNLFLHFYQLIFFINVEVRAIAFWYIGVLWMSTIFEHQIETTLPISLPWSNEVRVLLCQWGWF